jgi:hypothetical protein
MGFFPRTNMPDREWWSVLWPGPEGVLRELGIPRGEVSVDKCSGDGYFTAPLSRLATPGKVYTREMDPETVGGARKYCPLVEEETASSSRTMQDILQHTCLNL